MYGDTGPGARVRAGEVRSAAEVPPPPDEARKTDLWKRNVEVMLLSRFGGLEGQAFYVFMRTYNSKHYPKSIPSKLAQKNWVQI